MNSLSSKESHFLNALPVNIFFLKATLEISLPRSKFRRSTANNQEKMKLHYNFQRNLLAIDCVEKRKSDFKGTVIPNGKEEDKFS